MSEIFTVPFRCDMYVDQGRRIGSDPVGHKCSGEAKWELKDVLLCDSCALLLEQEPHRLTFPERGHHGIAFQRHMMEKTLKRISETK